MKKLLLIAAAMYCSLQIHATIWVVTNSGNTFSPASITITAGDTVSFQLAGSHNAQEVGVNTYNANGNAPIIGFQTNFGGGLVTGLSVGTHYYVCDPHASMGMKGIINVNPAPTIIVPNVWINELHYDNTGTDSNEGFEIAGPSGTDLSCYKVYYYNGSNGQVYDSISLSGFLPFQACNWGAKWFGNTVSALQNGNPDGIALVYAPVATGCGMGGVDTVLQFLSYGGTFTATNGRLRFQTSVDIGITEGSSTQVNESLQLTGRGNRYSDFTWIGDTSNTHDAVNIGQNFCGLQHFTLLPASLTISEGVGQVTIPVFLDTASQFGTQVTVALDAAAGTATQGADFTFSDVILTWPAGTTGNIQVTVPILNDNIYELTETFRLVLRNPTNGASLTADSSIIVSILDNDPLSGGDCTDLYFSEYVAGSGNNKALEIYNPTASTIDLSVYSIQKTTDGGAVSTYGLSGTIAAGDVYVLANPNAVAGITAQADVLNAFIDFDGNDGLALMHLDQTIDVIGELGVNPGTSWAVGTGSTQNHTLIRNFYTYIGTSDWTTAAASYNVFTSDMIDSLGAHHTAPCGTVAPPPPAYIRFKNVVDTVDEANVIVKVVVEINNPTNNTYSYTVGFDAANSTAIANVDFSSANQTYSHGNGVHVDTINLSVIDDALIEQMENVQLRFYNVPANVFPTADSVYNLYIRDNDILTVSFIGAGLAYSEGDGTVPVKVVLSTPTDSVVTVRVTLAAGNATQGSDFVCSTDTIIMFPALSMDTQAVWVTIIDDNIDEANEQINFDMSNATGGATILVQAFTLTIVDNDTTATGIEELGTANGIKLYPNPAVNMLNLQTEADIEHMAISDVLGNIVIQQDAMATGKHSIDVSTLPAGMYMVNIAMGGRVIARKFIKSE